MTTQRRFDTQVIADAMGRHLRIQFEPELAHARSQANVWHHACNEIKLQLKGALSKLKLSEEKLKDTDAKM